MAIRRTGVSAANFISPLVYAVIFVIAGALNMAVIWQIDKYTTLVWPDWYVRLNSPGTTAWFAAVFLSSLFIFGLVFGGYSWLLLLLERLRRPRLIDHLRRCALLYAALVVSGFLLIVFADDDAGPGYGVVVLVFLCDGYAILMDAIILLGARRRWDRANSGGAR